MMREMRQKKSLPSAAWPTDPTLEERATQFLRHPARSLCRGDGGVLEWPRAEGTLFSLPFITAYSCGKPVGYIQNVGISPAEKLAIVCHIAVEKDLALCKALREKRIAETLARAFRTHVKLHYGVERIIFRENHHDYWELPYGRFFRRLGAVPRKFANNPRPDWHWYWGASKNEKVPGEEWEGSPPRKIEIPQPPYLQWGGESPRTDHGE